LSCRAPVPPLDPLFDDWPAGQVIHIIHDTAFAPESFNPGVDKAGKPRKPTRFAPIRNAKGRVVPYLYGIGIYTCFSAPVGAIPRTLRAICAIS